MAKKPTKKGSAKKAIRRYVDVQPSASQMKKAEECLQRSGTIKIGFKDVTVTKLPKSISPVMVFVD